MRQYSTNNFELLVRCFKSIVCSTAKTPVCPDNCSSACNSQFRTAINTFFNQFIFTLSLFKFFQSFIESKQLTNSIKSIYQKTTNFTYKFHRMVSFQDCDGKARPCDSSGEPLTYLNKNTPNSLLIMEVS